MDTTTDRQHRIEQIQRAAIPVFASKGFRRASMADLAAAAGVSRPALYQYFDNRADLFRSALEAVLVEATNAALDALATDGSIAERIDGYLQRMVADAYETLWGMAFAEEFLEARLEFAADIAEAELERGRSGLRAFIDDQTDAHPSTRAAATDLVILSPAGLKAGWPEPGVYRARLSTLARAAALLLES